MPVPGAPAIERNMYLTWDVPQVGDDVRLMFAMEVDDSLADDVVGDVGVGRGDRRVEVLEYASTPIVLRLAKGNIGIDHPFEKQSLEVIHIEALNESVRDGLLFGVGGVQVQHLDDISRMGLLF